MAIAERELAQKLEVTLELGPEALESLAAIGTNATSGDQTRQVLTGVCFRNGNAYATDSYIMVKRPLDPQGDWKGLDVIVQGKALADACKGAIKAHKALQHFGALAATLVLEEGKAHMSHMGGTVILPTIEGDFPKCEALIPDYSKLSGGPNVIAMNPWTLNRLFKAMGCNPKGATDAGTKGVRLEMNDALKPVIATPLNPENPARGLVMPVRMA
jgi:DNA polymerase III sliding clamp (beta) subunit (PCNA family)